MTIESDLAVLDANVLVYAYYEESEHFEAARLLLAKAQDEAAQLCVTPQSLAEFYATVTNPRRVTEPKSTDVALGAIAEILALPGMLLLPTPVDVVSRWSELLRRHPVTGPDFFDLQLVATMLGNGVRRLYTFNVRDFTGFDEIEALIPSPY